MDNLTQDFNNSLQTGYVDKTIVSNVDYQPELLVNQKTPPKKVLSSIIHELENCNAFFYCWNCIGCIDIRNAKIKIVEQTHCYIR